MYLLTFVGTYAPHFTVVEVNDFCDDHACLQGNMAIYSS
jgi:hypothetical protein